MKKSILISIMLILAACGGEGQKDNQVNGNNVVNPSCSGLTVVAKVSSSTPIPSVLVTGYVNNVLAFDDCSGGNKNGFTFTKPSQPVNGYYELGLSNPTFPYPQPNHQVNVRIEARYLCGTSPVQAASRTVTLEDRGGCYYSSFTP